MDIFPEAHISRSKSSVAEGVIVIFQDDVVVLVTRVVIVVMVIVVMRVWIVVIHQNVLLFFVEVVVVFWDFDYFRYVYRFHSGWNVDFVADTVIWQ